MISDLSTLCACSDVAEQMLLRCFQYLNTTGSTLADLDKAVDILAHLTAVRKSLIHLSDRDEPRRLSAPAPGSTVAEPPSDTGNRAGAGTSTGDNHSDSLPPDPDSAVRLLSAIRVIHPTHIIRDIPAIPLDRIEPALKRIMADLASFSFAPCSSEPQNQPSPHDHSPEPDSVSDSKSEIGSEFNPLSANTPAPPTVEPPLNTS